MTLDLHSDTSEVLSSQSILHHMSSTFAFAILELEHWLFIKTIDFSFCRLYVLGTHKDESPCLSKYSFDPYSVPIMQELYYLEQNQYLAFPKKILFCRQEQQVKLHQWSLPIL